MTVSETAWLSRSRWMEDFIQHVVVERPQAPLHKLASHAARLYAYLGQFDPVDVAEAEWNELP